MIARATVLLGLFLTSSLTLAEDEQLQAFFNCDEASATADWAESDPTDLYAQGQILWVKVWYYWDEDNLFKSYKYDLEFSGGSGSTASATHTTAFGDEPYTQGYLWQKLDTGGDRYYKDFNLDLYAEVKDAGNNSILDWATDEITVRVYNSPWTADTQTDITCPKSSRWRFDDIAVTGNVTAQNEDGSGWSWVLDGRWVDLTLLNAGTSLSASVQTTNGQFSHTFSRPTVGWDPDDDYKVTATFRADQLGPHRPYESSSDSEQHTITRTIQPNKSTWQTTITKGGTFTVENPADDTTWDSSASVYDLDGTLRGVHDIMGPPPHGVTVINEDTLDDDLTTINGTIVMGSVLPGYETWAQPPGRNVTAAPGYAQPGPQAWIETLAFQNMYINGPAAWSWGAAWGYDPPTESATLTMRFYNVGGALVRTEYATIAPYQRFEIPPYWLAGSASMHAEVSKGLLAGWARAENGTSAAFETIAHTYTAAELCAPFMSADWGWHTLMILHNPTASPVDLEMRWYDGSGAPLAVQPRSLPPRATMTFDSDYVAPPVLSKAVEVRVTSGAGVVGSCVRTTDVSTTMAEPLVQAGSALRIPSLGTMLFQEGLLALHNPDDTAVTVQVAMYSIDGTPCGGMPGTIAPHGTYMFPVTSPLPGIEPIPSVTIRTANGGRVAAIMMLRQIETGGAASVPALSMPDLARCEPPRLQEAWNLISIPLDPLNPATEAVLAALVAAGNNPGNAVYAYRPTGYTAYPTGLAELARGEGYWLKLTNPLPFSVVGDAARAEVTIGLGKCWNLIGCPKTTVMAWADCSLTDGTNTKTVAQANDAGWIQSTLYYYEPSVGYRLVKTDGSGDDSQIRPWYGYWLRAYQPGLSLVVGGASGVAAASRSQSEGASRVKIHVTTAAALDWDFVAGLDPAASDSLDPLDLGAPPSPPPGAQPEVRFTSTIDPYGPYRDDWRIPPCQGTRTWPAVVSAINFSSSQCEQVTLTWDVSSAGDYAYQLVDLQTGQTIDLVAGGDYPLELCWGQVLPFELHAQENGRSPADFNCDGHVDQADLDAFIACATGPAIHYDSRDLPASCSLAPDGSGKIAADFDRDGDVDSADFAMFQRCWSGPDHSPAPNCTN